MFSFFGNMIFGFSSRSRVPARSNRNKIRRHKSGLDFQSLEKRQVLTSVFLDVNGSLFINATEAADLVRTEIVGTNVRTTINNSVFSTPVSSINELVFLGRGGNDQMTNGTSIPSRMFGGAGDDILTGGSGPDRLIANQGNDILRGMAGNDILIGGQGIKTLEGGDGDDQIRGSVGGKNIIRGGNGNDILFGGDFGDEIYGEAGDDLIYGLQGNDLLYGGPGKDLIMGNEGNDSLYSEGDNNRLYGGGGSDGLFAGLGTGNVMVGGAGKDRFLVAPGRSIPTLEAQDAALLFVNRSSNWTYREIEAIDRGARALHHRTNGTKVLKDTTASTPLTIAKYALRDSALSGGVAANFNSAVITINPNGTHSAVYTREIRFEEFDENSPHRYHFAGLSFIHEVSHSWDSVGEINRIVPQGAIWDQFRSLSGWTSQNPNSSAYIKAPWTTQEAVEYQVSSGQATIPVREWWYLANASFANNYSKNNAKEDWGVSWETAFVDEVYTIGTAATLGYTAVPLKVAKINQFLATLA